ncbi:DedA family protein [Gemmatimonadota bacterium]
MEQLTLLLEQYGYPLLFGLGFLEFIGAPIASVPVLIVAGGLAASGGVSVPGIILSAALGGLLADSLWYGAARLRGRGLVDSVCGLSSNPMACVLTVERKVAAVGPAYLLPAKFIPGAGNLVAAASGLTGMTVGAFLVMDGLGVLAWATVYAGVGWIFSAQVDLAIEWATGFASWLVGGALVLIAVAGVWRFVKTHMHRGMHDSM